MSKETIQSYIRTPEEDVFLADTIATVNSFVQSLEEDGNILMPYGNDSSWVVMTGFEQEDSYARTNLVVAAKPRHNAPTLNIKNYIYGEWENGGNFETSVLEYKFVEGDMYCKETPLNEAGDRQEPVTRVNDENDAEYLKRLLSKAPELIADHAAKIERSKLRQAELNRRYDEPGYKKLGRKLVKPFIK